MKYYRQGKAIIIAVSLRELDCFPDKLSVSSQSDDRQPAHYMVHTYTGELTAPVSSQ